jgi:hypothetical protein
VSVTPDDLTPRQGKVLRFAVMNKVIVDQRILQYHGHRSSDLPPNTLASLHTLWKLVQLGLLSRKLVGHIPTAEGRRVLREADSRHLWAS